jgi:hypothetical protein
MQRDFDIKASDGSTAGNITAHYDPTMRRINVTNINGEITPGARVNAMMQLREAFPEAKTIGGVRSSGVQAANPTGMGMESTLSMGGLPLMAPQMLGHPTGLRDREKAILSRFEIE